MRKFVWIALISLALLLSSCMLFPSKEDLMNDGMNALQSGDLDGAEEKFNEVLNMDPNDANAHAALALIYFFRAYLASYNTFEDYTPDSIGGSFEKLFKTLRTLPIRAMFRNSAGTDLGETLDEITDAQEHLEEYIIPDYEKAFEHASRAIEIGGVNLKIYPNRLDIDGDGTVEPDTPLKFRTNKGKSFTVEDLYKCTAPELDDDEIVFIDQSGGDAWFDYHILASGTCGDPVFNDDDDYITVDDGDMMFIKMVSGFILGSSYIFVTYKFEMPEETVEVLNSNGFEQILRHFDKNGDLVITTAEFKDALGNFLTFREKGQEHLSGSIDMFKGALESALDLDEEIESDAGGDHNFTSQEFFDDFLATEDRENVEEFIGYLTDTPAPLNEASGIYLKLFVLKEHPENFSDLKDFFPTVDLKNNIIEFPDPTFGGLVDPGEWDGTISD